MAFLAVMPGSVVPSIEVAVDFDNDPTAGTTTWTDVTPYVVAYSRNPVRTNEFDQPGVCTGQITLRNDDARFIPDNVAGPYFGKLKKLRRVRVRAQWGGVTYNRFWGYVDDWPQSWDEYGRDQSVTLQIKDGLTPLETFDLVGQDFPAVSASGSAVAQVLTAAGITARSLDTGQSPIPDSGTLSSTFALQRVHDIAASENGVVFADGGGTIEFHDRRHRLTQSAVVQGTIGDAPGEIPYTNPQPLFGDVWPIVTVTANGGTLEMSTDAAGTASYYQRTLAFPPSGTYLVASQAEAKAATQYLVNRYAAPVTRVASVDLIGARSPSLWGPILNLDTSDRVIFRRRFLSNGTVAGTVQVDGFVEGYGETVKIGESWVVSVPISPADLQSYWLAGDAVYGLAGETTRAGY